MASIKLRLDQWFTFFLAMVCFFLFPAMLAYFVVLELACIISTYPPLRTLTNMKAGSNADRVTLIVFYTAAAVASSNAGALLSARLVEGPIPFKLRLFAQRLGARALLVTGIILNLKQSAANLRDTLPGQKAANLQPGTQRPEEGHQQP